LVAILFLLRFVLHQLWDFLRSPSSATQQRIKFLEQDLQQFGVAFEEVLIEILRRVEKLEGSLSMLSEKAAEREIQKGRKKERIKTNEKVCLPELNRGRM